MHSRGGDRWRERFISLIELDGPPVRLDVGGIYAAADVAALILFRSGS